MVTKARGKARDARESASTHVEITMASRRSLNKMTSENVGISKEKKAGPTCSWARFLAHNRQGHVWFAVGLI